MKRFEFQNPRQAGKHADSSGFSLVETMVVVSILGILAAFSITPMGKYIARARQAEAKTTLGHAASLQGAYAIETSTYASITGSYGGSTTQACSGQSQTNCGNIAGCTWSSGSCSGTPTSPTTTTHCASNPLGLKMAGCATMRYSYEIVGDSTGYVGVATTDGQDLIFGCQVQTTAATMPANPGDTKLAATIPLAPPSGDDVWWNSELKGVTAGFDVTDSTNCQ